MLAKYKLATVCLLVATAVFAGCGGGGLCDIHGTVTFNGQPVKKGAIKFLPPDGKGPTAAAIIADGAYATKVAAGSKLVKIEGFNVKGTRNYPGSSVPCDILEQYLPARYNTQSELTRDITPSVRAYNFALQK
jgi:hypothetical protein